MNNDDFRKWGHVAADWAADYRATLGERPVRAPLHPGRVLDALPSTAPERGEAMEAIVADFENLIIPGMTHWQHPRFFAYFPANAPAPSVIAEQYANAIAAQCMLWQTSPAATELETRMMEWLRDALGLSKGFTGVINDSASSATFSAVLMMRERATSGTGNSKGLAGQKTLRVYASREVHSSIDKAIWMAGIGIDNLVRIPVAGKTRAMDAAALDAAITADLAAGHLPCGIIACVGGTSVGGTDNIEAVVAVARKHNLFVYVDAAWAGSAMICEEYRHFWQGIDGVDALVFNPHKWLGTQFDCAVLFVKEPSHLAQTLAIRPDYLKTQGADGIVNYSELSTVLGRRFRALKIWFLLRSYGIAALRDVIRNHVAWAEKLAAMLSKAPDMRIVTNPMLSLFSFRHEPASVADLDAHNLALVKAINDDGRIYLTQSSLEGRTIIRFQCGSFDMREADVDVAYQAITEVAAKLNAS
jgi:aromatic-L-amino-acid/L-tryptophan decarboxylase